MTEDEVEIKREKKILGMGRKYALEKRQEMIRKTREKTRNDRKHMRKDKK